MDVDLTEQLVCSDCDLVYGEMLAFGGHRHNDIICPRCGARDGAVAPLRYLYDVTKASLMRF